MLAVPQRRIRHLDARDGDRTRAGVEGGRERPLRHDVGFAALPGRLDIAGHGLRAGDDGARGVNDVDGDRARCGGLDTRFDHGIGFDGIGRTVRGQRGRRHRPHHDAVGEDMPGVARPQRDRPVDAGAGIPTGVGLVGVAGDDADLVRFAGGQRVGHVDAEIRVAVGAEGELHPVHPHLGVVVDAFELKQQSPAGQLGAGRIGLDVFVVAAVEPAGVDAARGVLMARFADHGVMRQAYGRERFVRIQMAVGPSVVEINGLHGRFLRVVWALAGVFRHVIRSDRATRRMVAHLIPRHATISRVPPMAANLQGWSAAIRHVGSGRCGNGGVRPRPARRRSSRAPRDWRRTPRQSARRPPTGSRPRPRSRCAARPPTVIGGHRRPGKEKPHALLGSTGARSGTTRSHAVFESQRLP